MKSTLAATALLIGVMALTSVSNAATYVVPAPGLVGEYGGTLEGDLNQDGFFNVGDLQYYVAARMMKRSHLSADTQFRSISEVRLHLVGTLLDGSGGAPTYFSVDNYATSCPPVNGSFDQTTVISGYSTSLLDGQDTIELSLMTNGGAWFDVDGNAWITYARCTVTAASLEVDGVPHLFGDINGDGYVNVGDLQVLVAAWNSHAADKPVPGTPASPNWNPNADLNGDGYVNIGDLQLLLAHWGPRI